MPERPLEITCAEVKQLQQDNSEFLMLDCRETQEHEIGVIAEARLLPMSELQNRHEELADCKTSHIVVYCHHGMRSAQVANWLRGQGYEQTQSMAGGVDQWSQEIDPSVPRY